MNRLSIHSTALLCAALCAGSTVEAQGGPGLPSVPVPPQNPITPAKAVLGKFLFWDEQLSSDSTIACGTCHLPTVGGSDPRTGRHPGLDGLLNTPDDTVGSPGVVHRDLNNDFEPSPTFDLDEQVTRRYSPSAFTGQYTLELFWDGRAIDVLVDPLTGATVISSGAALEVQALGPILDSGEMGHDGRTWADVTAKLATAKPGALMSNLPPDMAAAVAGDPSYGDLFQAAFGDPAITPVRIAMAIATYERQATPDQTPFDTRTMTPAQRRGFQAFQQSRCDLCHQPPFFSDDSYRNLGLRPVAEDLGRQEVTGSFADRGRFRVPNLRGVGLRNAFMHNGMFDTLDEVLRFYDQQLPIFRDNRDPLLDIVRVPPPVRRDLEDFLANALTDPRQRAGTFPFDRPTLRSERAPNRTVGVGSGAGAGQPTPRVLDHETAYVGNPSFRIGLDDARGNSLAFLALSPISLTIPQAVNGLLLWVDLNAAATAAYPVRGAGAAAGDGWATAKMAIPDVASLRGTRVFAQWFAIDSGAPNGLTATAASEFVIE